MPNMTQEAWTVLGIVIALVFGGVVGKVWKPFRQTVAAIDVIAGRPARYPGDDEATPNLAERLDRIDLALSGVTTDVAAVRLEVDVVKRHVKSMETEWMS